MASKTTAPIRGLPDLKLQIRSDDHALFFVLDAPDLRLKINSLEFQSSALPAQTDEILRSLLRDIDHLSLETPEDRQIAEHKIADKGAILWHLFPEKLRRHLWSLRADKKRVLTLQIQTDDLRIPWEMAKLQRPGTRGSVVPGPFLCEAYAVTRWLAGIPQKIRLPLSNLAVVVPPDSKLPSAPLELGDLRALAGEERRVTEIDPTFSSVRQAFAEGTYDGWHFAGHGVEIRGDDADRWSIVLSGYHRFAPENLENEVKNLGWTEPLVFLNGCHTGRGGISLTGLGGWSRRFLEAGVGAFLGAHWAITDSKARLFAQEFYRRFLGGIPIGESVRQARLALRDKHPGDPAWLAYTAFAHPLAAVRPEVNFPALEIPQLDWHPRQSPPGALLRAEYGIVPFHGREPEVDELRAWCLSEEPVRVRLYTGPGGMGKTRLALEACKELRAEGWLAGFLKPGSEGDTEQAGDWIAISGGPLLVVVDYAETRRPLLLALLRGLTTRSDGKVRLILLARAALDWWEQLKAEGQGVGDLLSGRATSRHPLRAVALSKADREKSYRLAAGEFARRLHPPALSEEVPDDLDAAHYERILLLHMTALAAIEGERVNGEDGILDYVLRRERKYWAERTEAKGLAASLAPGIGRAMAALTLGGGVRAEAEAVAVLKGLAFFADQTRDVLVGIARLLHETYPGERWIEPILPDLLGEHLVMREMEDGADELLDLVFGPANSDEVQT